MRCEAKPLLGPEVLRELRALCTLAIEEASRQSWRSSEESCRTSARAPFAEVRAAAHAGQSAALLAAGHLAEGLRATTAARDLEAKHSQPRKGVYHRLHAAVEAVLIPFLRERARDQLVAALTVGGPRWLLEAALLAREAGCATELADDARERLSQALIACRPYEARRAQFALGALLRGVAERILS